MIFQKRKEIEQILTNGGYTSGSFNNRLKSWAVANGATSSQLNEAVRQTLINLGYSGHINQMSKEFLNFSLLDLFTASDDGVLLLPSPTTCFQDSGATIPANVGDPVGYVIDLSGNNRHATQTSDGARPTLRQHANGSYYLEGDGTEWLQAPTVELGTHTHVGVWEAAPASIGGAYGLSANGRVSLTINQNTGAWITDDTIFVFQDVISTDTTEEGVYLSTIVRDTTVVGRLNGVEEDTVASPFISGVIFSGVGIFSRSSVSLALGLAGNFYGGMWIDRSLTATELNRAESFMAEQNKVVL